MRWKFIFVAAAAAVAFAAFQGSAFAQAAPSVGAVVKDKAGATLGVIERVVSGPDGRPYQVLVRQGQVVRPLLVEALTPKSGGYVSVLSKAEFEILPTAE
jgi:hypothetical protein